MPLPAAVTDADRVREVRSFLKAVHHEQLDRLARLATTAIGTPCGLISLLDDEHQHYSGADGLGEPYATTRKLEIGDSFCQFVVDAGGPLVIDDAREHPVTAGSPAIEEWNAVAYLGVPLRGPDGTIIGTVCAVEPEPRPWQPRERQVLEDVAAIAAAELQMIREASDVALALEAVAGEGVPAAAEPPIQPELADVDDVLRSVRALVEPIVPPGVRLLVDPAPREAATVVTDPARLAEMLRLVLAHDLTEAAGGAVHLATRCEGGQLVFSVADTLPGDPDPALLEGDEPGLPHARRLARRLGGDLLPAERDAVGTRWRARVATRLVV